MQLFFGQESWDNPRILVQNEFPTDYQGKTLQFCREWLKGKTEFQIQTSGSTGTPKTICIQRSQMQESAKATAKKLNLTSKHTALIALNTNYIAGKMMLVRCLEVGMNAHIIEPSANPLETFENKKFDFTAFVPLQLETILEQSPEKINLLNQMHAIIIGGAPVNQELTQKIQAISAPIFATYGMTETVSHIALKCLNGTEKQGYYETLPNVKIGQDSRNCLTISAPMSLHKKLITNDIVNIISNFQFEWLGRFDNVINSGGVKIQAEKIEQITEQILVEIGLKIRCLVLGIPDKKLGQKVVLCLETKPLNSELIQKIEQQLQNQLSRYETPKNIFYLEKFASTPTGKIARQEIIEIVIHI